MCSKSSWIFRFLQSGKVQIPDSFCDQNRHSLSSLPLRNKAWIQTALVWYGFRLRDDHWYLGTRYCREGSAATSWESFLCQYWIMFCLHKSLNLALGSGWSMRLMGCGRRHIIHKSLTFWLCPSSINGSILRVFKRYLSRRETMPRMESWQRWRRAGAWRVPARNYTPHPGVFLWSFMSIESVLFWQLLMIFCSAVERNRAPRLERKTGTAQRRSTWRRRTGVMAECKASWHKWVELPSVGWLSISNLWWMISYIHYHSKLPLATKNHQADYTPATNWLYMVNFKLHLYFPRGGWGW